MTTLLEACTEWNDSTDAAESRAAIRAKVVEILAAPPDVVDPDRATPEFDKAIAAASAAPTEAAAWACFERVEIPSAPEPAPDFTPLAAGDATEPEPVLWWEDPKDSGSARRESRRPFRHAVLSVGEVAILTSPGGLGKSMLTLELAVAATTAPNADAPGGRHKTACGLWVRGGSVALVSYEDSPGRIAARLKRMTRRPGVSPEDAFPSGIHAWRAPEPLLVGDDHGAHGLAPDWRSTWDAIAATGPALVVIDPASAAMAGADMNQSGPVRMLMRELGREASAVGCGVLVVAHDTKPARNRAADGEDPGAGAVAGSATWYDAARGVLYMRRDGDMRNVDCLKSNYGRSGWRIRLRERTDDSGALVGFEAVDSGMREPASNQRVETAGRIFTISPRLAKRLMKAGNEGRGANLSKDDVASMVAGINADTAAGDAWEPIT